jgi:hypothetical protein
MLFKNKKENTCKLKGYGSTTIFGTHDTMTSAYSLRREVRRRGQILAANTFSNNAPKVITIGKNHSLEKEN